MSYYSNMKRYDQKGRRVAIFGKQVDGTNKMDIEVFVCSQKDQFSRHTAIDAYILRDNRYHPQKHSIELEDGSKPKWSFLKWCRENFKKREECYIGVPGKVLKIETVNTKLSKPHNLKATYLI